jgi:hypothetical protein
MDDTGPGRTDIAAPTRGELYAVNGRLLDLVLQYQSTSGDIEGYAEFVRNAIQRYGAITRTVQITEEPNVTGNATLDGDYPDVLRAIVAACRPQTAKPVVAASVICESARTQRRCSVRQPASTWSS